MPGLLTTRTPFSSCPRCGAKIDAATSTEPGKYPKPGSVSICWYCGEILLLDAKLRSVMPSLEQMIELQRSEIWPKLEHLALAIKVRKAREDR